ncbi:MAG: lpxB [Fibrobacteres bacterium]|nr:lpxB [Fibrobacterota bacterium]
MTGGPRIFVSAGEVSGDRILGEILEPLLERFPGSELRGLGGAAAEACGLQALFPIADTAFSGAWDVIRNTLFAVRMYRAAVREMRRFRPHLVLLVDYPGLNLRLARKARNLGVPVCFVAPPQAWAYRNPARKIRRAAAALQGCHVHALFPFEMESFAAAASRVTAGHFLAAPETAPGREKNLLLLCPGSRLPVLRRNLPVWLDLLDRVGRFPEAGGGKVAVLVPVHLASAAREILATHADGRFAARLRLCTDKESIFAETRHAIAFPGTITLELALHRVPTLVLAIVDPLTLALGRRALGDSRLALPNLLSGEDMFPEWAGTAPGPDPARFLELEKRRDHAPGWGRCLEKLAERMGPATGAQVAVEACAGLLQVSWQVRAPEAKASKKS